MWKRRVVLEKSITARIVEGIFDHLKSLTCALIVGLIFIVEMWRHSAVLFASLMADLFRAGDGTGMGGRS